MPGSGESPHYPSAGQYNQARSELVKVSLIKRNKSERTLSVHRVVQDVARDQLSEGDFFHVFALTVSLITTVWPEDQERLWLLRVADRQETAVVAPHILKVISIFQDKRPTLTIAELRMFVPFITITIRCKCPHFP